MTTENPNESKRVRALIVVTCVVLGLAWLPMLGFASPALPPLNTLTPYPPGQATPVYTVTPPPVPRPVAQGAAIELRAAFPAAWPWETAHWGTLWTVVQWQDEKGHWHDVEGWRGELDGVEIDAAGQVVGLRIWWVADDDLDTGPFRWQVYREQGGRLLGTSEAFDLPDSVGRTVTVAIVLPEG